MSWKRPFILGATDFSPRAIEAASAAAKLAQARFTLLRLVHVSDADATDALVAAMNNLEAEVQRLRSTGATVESLLLKGARPSGTLIDYVWAEMPILVVVGSNIKGSFDRWAIGSFSERLAESSPVPTLVVRNAAPFRSWDWAGERLKVLLALDLYSSSDVVLRWAKAFQHNGPCDFTSCFVNSRIPTSDEVALRSVQAINPPLFQSHLEDEIRKKIRDQMGDGASAVVVKPSFGKPGSCLAEIAREMQFPVIVVGAHQRRGMDRMMHVSVSRELLHESEANVVCVPTTAKFDPREAHIPDYHRVLVATDFSEIGDAAVPYACAACCMGGLLKIIHVVPSRAQPPGTTERSATIIELEDHLSSLIPLESIARGRPPESEVLEQADVAEAICAEADRFGADLVCLASHGMGASRALHGSVTSAVLKKLHRPLLIIRRPDE